MDTYPLSSALQSTIENFLRASGRESVEQLLAFLREQRNSHDTANHSVDNSGFRTRFLDKADPQKVEEHRTELIDLCRVPHGSARRVAEYIYDKHSAVFNCQWPPRDVYHWLQTEFGFTASRDNFYKACRLFSNYKNR